MKRQVHPTPVDAPAGTPRVPLCRTAPTPKTTPAPALRRPSAKTQTPAPNGAHRNGTSTAGPKPGTNGSPSCASVAGFGPDADSTTPPPPTTPTPAPRRILVADAHPMFRTGLAHWIRLQGDLTVCAEVSTAAEALAQLARRQADLFVTDLTLPGRSGLELIRDALALSPRLPLLILSAHDESLHAERALRAGARGYLMKESSGDEILAAIRWVLAGKVWVSPRMSERLLETIAGCRPRGSRSPIESLTDREFEVFQLIGCGQSTREIAGRLHISPKTVEVHRGHLRAKLALKDSTALIHHAVRWAEAEAEGPVPVLRR